MSTSNRWASKSKKVWHPVDEVEILQPAYAKEMISSFLGHRHRLNLIYSVFYVVFNNQGHCDG